VMMLPVCHYSNWLSVDRPCADLIISCADGSVPAHRYWLVVPVLM
jgi:hypothetical protein